MPTPMTFSTLIAALQASKVDVIAAAMYITPTRQEVVDFSDPIITYGEGVFVAAKDTKDYTAMADLEGEIVGVQIGTAYVKPLTDSGLFKEIKVYDTIPDIMRDVNLGRIKAGFADYPIVARRKGSMKAPEQVLLDEPKMAKGHGFFAVSDYSVSQDNRLLAYAEEHMNAWDCLAGLLLATGHYRNGILLAPRTADLLAELIVTHNIPRARVPFMPVPRQQSICVGQ